MLRCGSDHYAILGVSKTAEEVKIKKAYKKVALKLHLDKNHAKSDEAFKGICTATPCVNLRLWDTILISHARSLLSIQNIGL